MLFYLNSFPNVLPVALPAARLATLFPTLTVECLPAKIPASVELDISSLTEAEQMVRVKSIELAKGVTILNDPELVVVKISSRPVKVMAEREVTEEAVEAPEAAPPPEKKAPKEE